MKRLLLLALTAVIMAGCKKFEDESLLLEGTDKRLYQIVIVDSCEYLQNIGAAQLAHKGNCKYCAERRKQEIRELIKELKME